MALTRINRLTKEKDFKTVYNTGETVRNSFLFIKFLKNKTNESRFGIVISSKVSKKATIRNNVKRKISETIRKNQRQIVNGIDVVIVANSKIVDKEFTEIERMVLKLMKKARLLS